jgi:hypothetical protein
MMIEPGFGPGMGRGLYGRICRPGAAGFAEWWIAQIEQAIKPTEPQPAKLEELKTASAKAAEIMTKACPTELPLTPVGMLAAMECARRPCSRR